jgi:hypothetical protein
LLSSDLQPDGYHLEDVSYLAAVIEAPEHMLAGTPFSFFQRLSEQLKEETGGAAVFMGVYRTAAPTAKATLRVLASSQALPDGVAELLTHAKREGAELQAKLHSALRPLALGEIEDFRLFRRGPESARRRMTQPQPQSDGEINVHRPDGANGANGTNGASAGATTLPDRRLYDVLAQQFKEADTNDARQRVSARLESDQNSSNSLVRYYAVRTMSRLAPPKTKTPWCARWR